MGLWEINEVKYITPNKWILSRQSHEIFRPFISGAPSHFGRGFGPNGSVGTTFFETFF